MRSYLIQFVLLALLSGCTTNRIEVNIGKDGFGSAETSSPTISVNGSKAITPKSDTEIIASVDNLIDDIVNVERKVANKCPIFTLPILQPVAPVPKDIVTKRQMSDEELIKQLTDYAYILRKHSIENRAVLNAAYKKYIETCKK